MDQGSSLRGSDDSDIKNLSERVRQLENLASHSFDVITHMIPPNECEFLAQQTSLSIVSIRCWRRGKFLGDKGKLKGGRGSRSISACTGFIIDSSQSTLVLTCASIMASLFNIEIRTPMETIQSEATIQVRFFDKEQMDSDLVYLDFSHDLAILRVQGIVGKPCLRFFEKEAELEGLLTGLPIYSISHPQCHNVIQPYSFTSGMTSQSCIPVSNYGLAGDCHCIMYCITMDSGSAGAPILSTNGEVIAVHSNYYNAFYFGIGLRSIRAALIKFFNLSSDDYEDMNTNDLLDYVLGGK